MASSTHITATIVLICLAVVVHFIACSAAAYKGNSNYETVYPRKVTKQGHFLSYDLRHSYKRSVPSSPNTKRYIRDISSSSTSNKDHVHYIVSINGIEHHLQLHPGAKLTRRSSVVESVVNGRSTPVTHHHDGHAKIKRMDDDMYHYQGSVQGDLGSKVAVSTRHGLVGYIRTRRGYFFIQPDGPYLPGRAQRHVVFPYQKAAEESSPHDGTATAQCKTSDPRQDDYDYNLALGGAGRDDSLPQCPALVQRDTDPLGRRDAQTKTAGNTTKVKAKVKHPEIAEELHIETMVVLDHAILRYHKEVDIENYVLTVFNMAHSLFHDTSLGKNINLAIVRLVRLEAEEYELNVVANKNPTKTLDYFRDWQKKMNPSDDSHPNHHDVAILLTRLDVCGDSKTCGLLGAAHVGGVCDPDHQVAICQDTGLRLGFVIAHQIGHALGMPHDTLEESDCTDQLPGGSYTVMSPTISLRTQRWSNCSRNALKTFLDSGFGTCLNDPPTEHSFELVDVLPGVMYDADYQCRTRMGPNAAQCMTGLDCDNLICYIEDKGCVETHVAAAPGTKCGEKKWCFKGKCVQVGERSGAIHGGWSDWSGWTKCSRTCGSGVASQVRHCNKPTPSNGGKYCFGEHKRHRICSTDPCDMAEPSFRDVQCAEFNAWVYPEDGKIHQWKSYPIHDENPCLLFCVNDKGIVASLRPRVIDGTKCQYGLSDICINGLCREIPCDMDLESNAMEDRCGVCRGDGTSCRIVEGHKSFNCSRYSGEYRYTEIPTSAVNIKVEETMPSQSRIQIRDKDGNIMYITGEDLGLFDVPGSRAWMGLIRAEQEAISIPGPITKNISIWISLEQNVTVKYSYGMAVEKRRKPSFSWDYLSWTRCSAECGVGTQESVAMCVERKAGLVDETHCCEIARPREQIRPCEIAPCIPRWYVGDWQPCMCGHHSRVRMAKCVRPTGEGEGEMDIIDNSNCVPPKPKTSERCVCRVERKAEPTTVTTILEETATATTIIEIVTGNVTTTDSSLTAMTTLTMLDMENITIETTTIQSMKFDLATMKNNTVIDWQNLTLVNLTVHADLQNGLFPQDVPHPKHITNISWYAIGGREAMQFINLVQNDFSDNKTRI